MGIEVVSNTILTLTRQAADLGDLNLVAGLRSDKWNHSVFYRHQRTRVMFHLERSGGER